MQFEGQAFFGSFIVKITLKDIDLKLVPGLKRMGCL
jgi:hypothetical protein